MITIAAPPILPKTTSKQITRPNPIHPPSQPTASTHQQSQLPFLSRADQSGLTMDSCNQTAHCKVPRKCVTGFTDQPKPCNTDQGCVCFPSSPPLCNASEECQTGEVCAYYSTDPTRLFCVSENAVDRYSTLFEKGTEPSPVAQPDEIEGDSSTVQPAQVPDIPETICIAIHSLKHFDPKDLVFDKHPLARVLCDRNGSCATPGHIVLVSGTPMMMKTYCAKVTCDTHVMPVNSPKYRRRLTVESNSDGLSFTTFAARYETRTEEVIISAALRLGM